MFKKERRCTKYILACLANPEIVILITKIWSPWWQVNKSTQWGALILFCWPSFAVASCPLPGPLTFGRLREREKIDCPVIDPLHRVGAAWLLTNWKLIIHLPRQRWPHSCELEGQWLGLMQHLISWKVIQSHLLGWLFHLDCLDSYFIFLTSLPLRYQTC